MATQKLNGIDNTMTELELDSRAVGSRTGPLDQFTTSILLQQFNAYISHIVSVQILEMMPTDYYYNRLQTFACVQIINGCMCPMS